ncbi:MAG TPA: hypothetical protein VFD36_15500 [Kofleriaceae bacterium]|nr:hypothetical protein [Kofleriaceae bacterium]
MALARDPLRNALAGLFNGTAGYPGDAVAAGTAWATIYGDYAANAAAATAVPTVPVQTDLTTALGTLGKKLGDAFIAALGAPPPHYPTLVTDMVAAFLPFWPSVGFKSPDGNVTGVAPPPPPQPLIDALTAFFQSGNPSLGPRPGGDDQAALMADKLDTWTRTVAVVNTPSGGSPLPPVLLT